MKVLLFLSLILSSLALSCTNVFIYDLGFVSVGRTMDFSVNTGNVMGYGASGTLNTSNVNMPQTNINAVEWVNKHSFIGQTGFKTNIILDGINSAGVYAGFLYLPAITEYPKYDPQNHKPQLGVFDSANYVLALSASVEEAMYNLQNVQIVPNVVPLNVGGGKIEYLAFPLHLVVRDKNGSSLLVEWINGDTKTYYHKQGTNKTIESTNFENNITHNGFKMPVVTNAPQYSWHIQNIKQYDNLYNGNNSQKIDGQIMEGSGYMGLPGDYTPPSRFARAYVFGKFMPNPKIQAEADMSAAMLLESVVASPAASASPTLWISISNLKDNIYYFKPLISSMVKNKINNIAPYNIDGQKVIKFDLNQISKTKNAPRGFVNIVLNKTQTLTEDQASEALKFMRSSTKPPNEKAQVRYEENLAEFNKNIFDSKGVSFP